MIVMDDAINRAMEQMPSLEQASKVCSTVPECQRHSCSAKFLLKEPSIPFDWPSGQWPHMLLAGGEVCLLRFTGAIGIPIGKAN